jgi:spermidine synthase
MRGAFRHVLCLPEGKEGNVVALAFKSSPSLDADRLRLRAGVIAHSTRLPARSWVEGMTAGQQSA